jgi:hypothetical protein
MKHKHLYRPINFFDGHNNRLSVCCAFGMTVGILLNIAIGENNYGWQYSKYVKRLVSIHFNIAITELFCSTCAAGIGISHNNYTLPYFRCHQFGQSNSILSCVDLRHNYYGFLRSNRFSVFGIRFGWFCNLCLATYIYVLYIMFLGWNNVCNTSKYTDLYLFYLFNRAIRIPCHFTLPWQKYGKCKWHKLSQLDKLNLFHRSIHVRSMLNMWEFYSIRINA